ncbi:MAG: DUF1566 domain-containing protein [Holophagales bacterium]|nr:DUF1566 domain-containing protein [Holophagales bacterium]
MRPLLPSPSRSPRKAILLGAPLLFLAVATAPGSRAEAAGLSYPVVGTGVTLCYGNTTATIACPAAGQPFFGQDAQQQRLAPSYVDNGDGTTTDLGTGLTWVKERGTKLTFAAALAGAATCRVGGHADWRMPTIKELYSLILFSGKNGQGFTSSAGFVPFLDTRYFGFAYGSGVGTERVIDCQDWSATEYVSTTMNGDATVFGVNFADGRIKGYPKYQPGSGGTIGQSMYVRYVRGNPAYGANDFADSGDGTVTDRATGLTWSRADSGTGMNWQEALAWVQAKNAARHLGHDDWRLPTVKELQSLLDYSRSPDTTGSAAIDPLFEATSITNEGGARDWPFYWSSTTFLDGTPNGAAAYLAFGRGLGWMERPAGSGSYTLLDVHGAGTQRGDPKAGDPAGWPHGFGPQGDVIRIANHVRLVRDATASGATATLFLPVVLDVTGRARYTTELTLANRGTTDATVDLAYTAAASFGGQGSGTVSVALAAGRQLVLEEAIGFLRSSGLPIPDGSQGGTVRASFSGLSKADAAFAGVRVTAPSEGGRAGVACVAPRLEELPTGTSWLYGLRKTVQDRTHVALANASTVDPVTLRLALVNGNGTGGGNAPETTLPDVTLGPGQWVQLDDVFAGAPFSGGYARVTVVSGTGPYYAYAVFNDEVTNDGSFVPFTAGPEVRESLLVPVVVETGVYTTELVLTNPGAATLDVELTYVESLSPEKGAGGVAIETLAPGEQKILPQFLDLLRGKVTGAIGPKGEASYAGTLAVRFLEAGAAAPGIVGARTGSPSRSGEGHYGLYYGAVGTSSRATGEALVHGLRQDDEVRANVAVAASLENAGNVTLFAEVYDGETGALAGTSAKVSLPPGGWTQWAGLLPAFGLPQGYVRVVNETATGTFVAYGVVNDGATPESSAGTDDGSYVPAVPGTSAPSTAWRFAVVGDTHVTANSFAVPAEIVSALLNESVDLVLVPGDLVEGGKGATSAQMQRQLEVWQRTMAPLTDAGIGVYPVRGNHEADVPGGASAWAAAFSGVHALPANGPEGETGLTYSFTSKNALFVGLDEYESLHRVTQPWLDAQLAARTAPHVFVFGHEPAFKAFHPTAWARTRPTATPSGAASPPPQPESLSLGTTTSSTPSGSTTATAARTTTSSS